MNARIIDEFCARVAFQEYQGQPQRTEHQRHLVTGLNLQVVLRDLLTRLQFRNMIDSQQFTAVLSLLQRIVEHDPSTPATVYRMSGGRSRERRVDDDNRLAQLFQGPHPKADPSTGQREGSIYPGDREIKASAGVTVQVHNLTVVRKIGERTETIAENVPAIAIWIPADLARPILIQPQGGI